MDPEHERRAKGPGSAFDTRGPEAPGPGLQFQEWGTRRRCGPRPLPWRARARDAARRRWRARAAAVRPPRSELLLLPHRGRGGSRSGDRVTEEPDCRHAELTCLVPAAPSHLSPIVLGKVQVRGQGEGLAASGRGRPGGGGPVGRRRKGGLGDTPPPGICTLGKRPRHCRGQSWGWWRGR